MHQTWIKRCQARFIICIEERRGKKGENNKLESYKMDHREKTYVKYWPEQACSSTPDIGSPSEVACFLTSDWWSPYIHHSIGRPVHWCTCYRQPRSRCHHHHCTCSHSIRYNRHRRLLFFFSESIVVDTVADKASLYASVDILFLYSEFLLNNNSSIKNIYLYVG